MLDMPEILQQEEPNSSGGTLHAEPSLDISCASTYCWCYMCRGFGTVRYSTPQDAQNAAQIMNGAEIGQRTVTVRIDRFA